MKFIQKLNDDMKWCDTIFESLDELLGQIKADGCEYQKIGDNGIVVLSENGFVLKIYRIINCD